MPFFKKKFHHLSIIYIPTLEQDYSKSYHVFLLLHFGGGCRCCFCAVLTDFVAPFVNEAAVRVLEAADEAPPVNNILTPASTVSAVPLDIPVVCNPRLVNELVSRPVII